MTDSAMCPSVTPGTAGGPDPRRWKALILLCVTNFMIILDAQIVILALPSIGRHLHLSTGAGQWVLSAYLLTFGGLLLFGGRLADLFGRRRLFLTGTALFLASSLLCGLSWSGGILIAARVVQGISAAIMAPAALAILATTFSDAAERNKALAWWASMGGIGATAALLIGGILTTGLGWQAIFYLNVPVAVILLTCAPRLLAESRDRRRVRSLDPAGALTITAGLMLLIVAIVQEPTLGWSSGLVVGPLAGAAVLIAAFVVIEHRSPAPLVPLRILRSRMLVGGNLSIAVIAMMAWGMGFTVSAYVQNVLGWSPLHFGLATTVMTIMTVVGAYAAKAGVSKIGIRPVAVTSMALMGVGSLLLAQATANGSLAALFAGLFIFGPGLGGGPVAVIAAAMSSVAEHDTGIASGINTAAFQIGAGLGTAVVSSVIISQISGPARLGLLGAGYQAGFLACVALAMVGACAAFVLLRPAPRSRSLSHPPLSQSAYRTTSDEPPLPEQAGRAERRTGSARMDKADRRLLQEEGPQ